MTGISTSESIVWLSPPDMIALSPDEAHVWRADLDVNERTIAACRAVLSPDERSRADRFVRRVHGERFTCTRAALRCLLGRYVGLPPREVAIGYDGKRKPRLDGEHGLDVRFNVSHSRDKALLVFSVGHDIGVDIECVDREVECEKLARRFFASGEAARLGRLRNARQVDAFFNCWTAKEAYVKARGEGISFGLDRFEVACLPEEAPGIQRVDDASDAAERWIVKRFRPFPGYIASVAADRSTSRWEYFEITADGAE